MASQRTGHLLSIFSLQFSNLLLLRFQKKTTRILCLLIFSETLHLLFTGFDHNMIIERGIVKEGAGVQTVNRTEARRSWWRVKEIVQGTICSMKLNPSALHHFIRIISGYRIHFDFMSRWVGVRIGLQSMQIIEKRRGLSRIGWRSIRNWICSISELSENQ